VRGAHRGLAIGDGAAAAVARVVTFDSVTSVPGLGEDDDEVQRAEAGRSGMARGCLGWPRLMVAALGLDSVSNLDGLAVLFGWRCASNGRGEPGLLIEEGRISKRHGRRGGAGSVRAQWPR
jgi:hypothetical protein